ncbi:hypothetical protein D3C77_297330 [compost metagenome]
MTGLLLGESDLILVGRRHNKNDVASSLLKLVGKLPKGQAAPFIFVDLGLYDTQVDAVVGIEAGCESWAGVTGKWGVLACACLAAFTGEFTAPSRQFNATDGLFLSHRVVLRAKCREVHIKGWFHRLAQRIDQTLKGDINVILAGIGRGVLKHCRNSRRRAASHGELCANRMSQTVEVETNRFL